MGNLTYIPKILASLLLTLIAACGGGGGGDSVSPNASTGPAPVANPPVQPSPEPTKPPVPESPATDEKAPGKLVELAAPEATMHSLTFRWQATGDDGESGTADSYEFFLSADEPPCDVEPCKISVNNTTPAPAGEVEMLTLRPLKPESNYTLTVQAFDEAGNFSNQLKIDGRTLDNKGWTVTKITDVDRSKGEEAGNVRMVLAASGAPEIVWKSALYGTGEQREPGERRIGYAELQDGVWRVTPNLVTVQAGDALGSVNIRNGPNDEPVLSWRHVADIYGPSNESINFLTRQNGTWGAPEIVASGKREAGGLSDSSSALTLIRGVPTIFYSVIKTLTSDRAEYTLVVKQRNSAGNWSSAREIATCPNPPVEAGRSLFNPFGAPEALTLPPDATRGLAERGLILLPLYYNSGFLVAFEDASGAWNVRHTGRLPVNSYNQTAALAADGSIRLVVSRPQDSTGMKQSGILSLRVDELPALPPDCEPPPATDPDIEWIPETGSEESFADHGTLALSGGDLFLSEGSWDSASSADDLRIHARCDGQWSSELIDRVTDYPSRGAMLDPNGNLLMTYADYRFGAIYFATRAGNPCQ